MDLFLRPVFNIWSQLQTLAVCVPFFIREFNRKSDTTGSIRKLKEDDPDLPESIEGRVCIITGGSRGIGAEVVRSLLRKDCHVITGSSSTNQKEIDSRYEKIIEGIPKGKWKLEIWHLDLLSMDSVSQFVSRFQRTKLPLNYFIANAGVMFVPYRVSKQGFESHFAINYLSHSYLIMNLLPNLAQSSRVSGVESRVVSVSSCAHLAAYLRFDDLNGKSLYSPYFAYGQSKLAQIMFTYKLNRWLSQKSDWAQLVTAHCLHPGMVRTDLYDNTAWLQLFPPIESLVSTISLRTAKEGIETIIYAALSSQLNGMSGKYLVDCSLASSSNISYTQLDQEKLWKTTRKLLSPWVTDYMISDK